MTEDEYEEHLAEREFDRSRIRDLERERDALRAEVERLKAEVQNHSLCVEVRDGLLDENKQLREALRRLEWTKNLGFCVKPLRANVMGCHACGGQQPVPENEGFAGHKPYCWLAALLGGK